MSYNFYRLEKELFKNNNTKECSSDTDTVSLLKTAEATVLTLSARNGSHLHSLVREKGTFM